MLRPRLALGFLLAPIVFALAVLFAGCGGAVEQPVLYQFFQASRLRDNVTLGNIATVGFDPEKDGSVTSFSIISVTPEQATPLKLKEMAKAHQDAVDADAEFTKKKKAFQDENGEALNRIIQAEQKGTKLKLRGKDAEIQAAWNKWRDETAEYAKKVTAAREILQRARPVAELSMTSPRGTTPVDVTTMDGELLTKEATIEANVRTPGGPAVKKTLVITLQRAKLKDDKGQDVNGKWVVTGVKQAAASPATTS